MICSNGRGELGGMKDGPCMPFVDGGLPAYDVPPLASPDLFSDSAAQPGLDAPIVSGPDDGGISFPDGGET